MGRIMNNVTKMELYKVLSKPQVYIIFVVGLIIQSIMAGQMRTTMFNGYHKSVLLSVKKRCKDRSMSRNMQIFRDIFSSASIISR